MIPVIDIGYSDNSRCFGRPLNSHTNILDIVISIIGYGDNICIFGFQEDKMKLLSAFSAAIVTSDNYIHSCVIWHLDTLASFLQFHL